MFNSKVDEKFRQILADMRYHYETTGKTYDFCPLCMEVGWINGERGCCLCPWWQENPVKYSCEKWAEQQGFANITIALEDSEYAMTLRLEMLSRWLSTPA